MRHQACSSGFRVAAPRAGDMLSGALHRAYDEPRGVPADMLELLRALDRVAPTRR
ncbi:hypothetical protein ACFONA_16395 [Sphingomonas hylomeconis]|uniref:Anti-sigma factor NepR domain-containing protein n=2 Tax=Sphingomonas hylomeconis TaxID=1395958 RepID=A0ABV7SZH3_9SPHN